MEREEVIKDLKKAMGIVGIICGAIGIVAAIIMYFVLSSLIDRIGATSITTMDDAASAVDGGVASLDSASESVVYLSDFSQSMSASMEKLEEGSGNFSYYLSNLSESLGALGLASGSSLERLNNSASSFLEFSTQLEDSRSSLYSLSSSTTEMSSRINSTKDSIANAKADINEAKDTVKSVIGGLRLALFVGTFIVILLSTALMCYSAGILL